MGARRDGNAVAGCGNGNISGGGMHVAARSLQRLPLRRFRYYPSTPLEDTHKPWLCDVVVVAVNAPFFATVMLVPQLQFRCFGQKAEAFARGRIRRAGGVLGSVVGVTILGSAPTLGT